MPILTVISTYEAEVMRRTADESYASAHDASAANSLYTSSVYFGQWYQEAGGFFYYQIERGGFIFDTSALPAEAVITAVTLKLYGQHKNDDDATFDITVVNGADLQNPMVLADYGELLDDTISLGSINSADWSLTGYNNIALNAAGIALINKTGNTLLAVRSSRDINSTAPTPISLWSEAVECWVHTDTGKEPKLEITYGSNYSRAFIPRTVMLHKGR